jgi:hypothetical protein
LFVTYVPTASADMSLSANPTEVALSSPLATGKTTVTWSSGGRDSVQVHVKIDRGAFQPTGLAGPSGYGEYHGVKYGNAYTFRLFSSDGGVLVNSPEVVVTTKLKKLDLPSPCQLQCIKTVEVEPHGTFADIHVETTVPASFLVQASTASPNADGSCKTTELAGTLWKPSKSTTFDGQLQHLDAGTTHCLTVVAKDAAGHEAKQYVIFMTHRRFVTVTIIKIFVINDSDPNGSGEIEFELDLHTIQHQIFVKETTIATGQTIFPNQQFTVTNVPAAVKVAVWGRDDDGPIDTWEFSKAETVLDVGGPGGPGETIAGKSFSMTSTALDGDLKFKVSGIFDVTYGP